jgi:hypothetical protein
VASSRNTSEIWALAVARCPDEKNNDFGNGKSVCVCLYVLPQEGYRQLRAKNKEEDDDNDDIGEKTYFYILYILQIAFNFTVLRGNQFLLHACWMEVVEMGNEGMADRCRFVARIILALHTRIRDKCAQHSANKIFFPIEDLLLFLL